MSYNDGLGQWIWKNKGALILPSVSSEWSLSFYYGNNSTILFKSLNIDIPMVAREWSMLYDETRIVGYNTDFYQSEERIITIESISEQDKVAVIDFLHKNATYIGVGQQYVFSNILNLGSTIDTYNLAFTCEGVKYLYVDEDDVMLTYSNDSDVKEVYSDGWVNEIYKNITLDALIYDGKTAEFLFGKSNLTMVQETPLPEHDFIFNVNNKSVTFTGNKLEIFNASPDGDNLIITVRVDGIYQTQTINGVNKDGYSFIGLSTDSTETVAEYLLGREYTVNFQSNTTFYGIYEAVITPPVEHIFTFNVNDKIATFAGQRLSVISTSLIGDNLLITINIDGSVDYTTLEGVTKSGYILLGLSTNPSAISPDYAIGETVNVNFQTDTTFYGIYKQNEPQPVEDKTFIFNVNNKSVTFKGQTLQAINASIDGDNLIITVKVDDIHQSQTINGANKSGYDLIGLSTDSSETVAEYLLGQEYTVNFRANTTFYGIYKQSETISDFNIILYQNSAENNRLDKSLYLNRVSRIKGVLRDECDIINPVVLIQYSKVPDFNYVEIPLFNRFYFVTDVTAVRTNLWEIGLHCDVLYTYSGFIAGLDAFIDRGQTDTDDLIADTKMIVQQGTEVTELTVTNNLFDTPAYYVLQGFALKLNSIDVNGLWTWNDIIKGSGTISSWNVAFISNGVTYNHLWYDTEGDEFGLKLYYDDTLVYNNGWVNTAYKKIDVREVYANGDYLFNWLNNEAVKG